jgi:eukaryotic-like serine/threonine-protein kinase
MGKRNRMPSRLLVVDRDPQYSQWLTHHLEALCPDATVTSVNVPDIAQLAESFSDRDCDVLMLSAPFGSSPEDPEALGIELLRKLRDQTESPAVVVVAEEGNELTAVRSLQLGAVDYIPKRLLTPDRLKTAVKMALRRIEKRVARRLAMLAEEAEAKARKAADAQAADNAAAADSPADPMPVPDFIPGYTIRALIGDSEKAAVYLATSGTLGHNIALKVSKTIRDDTAGRQFLEREYTAIVAIKDPSVVQIYDYGVHNGHEFIAMEYLPRGDLKARMHQRITEDEALRFVEQIAMALQVVHNAGLLHRDLKPANVMLRENGNIALIDFGLARSLDGSTTQSTRTGVLRGSPYYMSPEQALGEPLDVRSDFYSLGVILFEMLTGRRPFTGSSAMDVLQQHVHSPTPPLPASLTHLEALLATLLAKNRDERFAQALEVAEAASAARKALESEPRTTAA